MKLDVLLTEWLDESCGPKSDSDTQLEVGKVIRWKARPSAQCRWKIELKVIGESSSRAWEYLPQLSVLCDRT